MAESEIFSPEFDAAVVAATVHAREATLRAGIPVSYIDANGVDIMEHPYGRKFEIRFLPKNPQGANYEVVRECPPAPCTWKLAERGVAEAGVV